MSTSSNTKAEIITFGCRLNAFESEIMRGHAASAGLNDAVIINTCAVTAEATRQARQAIRRARRENPQARIVVTGCAAQIEPGQFADMPEVDQVLGNTEKLDAASYAEEAFSGQRVIVNDIMSVKETAGHLIDGFDGRTRAFIQVQNGCDHRCTFCIIPFGRGNSRSVPVAGVVEQVQKLVDSGYQEIVLSGVDITSYGADLPGTPPLGSLVQRILRHVPELPRLRLSSLDVAEVDEALMDMILGEERLMPQLHLSLQAGDNMVLKRMKRRHSREQAIAFCESVRATRPDMTFGADLIAGFPTETDTMFENSLRLVDECDLAFLHVFPYSEREGTPATKMPSVDKAIRKDRARQLRQAGDRRFAALLDREVGKIAQVLIEKEVGDGLYIGRTETFAPVQVKGACADTLVSVSVTGHDGEMLQGVLSRE